MAIEAGHLLIKRIPMSNASVQAYMGGKGTTFEYLRLRK
jgi:hypothetical protein